VSPWSTPHPTNSALSTEKWLWYPHRHAWLHQRTALMPPRAPSLRPHATPSEQTNATAAKNASSSWRDPQIQFQRYSTFEKFTPAIHGLSSLFVGDNTQQTADCHPEMSSPLRSTQIRWLINVATHTSVVEGARTASLAAHAASTTQQKTGPHQQNTSKMAFEV
jgi:hypothetical protein